MKKTVMTYKELFDQLMNEAERRDRLHIYPPNNQDDNFFRPRRIESRKIVRLQELFKEIQEFLILPNEISSDIYNYLLENIKWSYDV